MALPGSAAAMGYPHRDGGPAYHLQLQVQEPAGAVDGRLSWKGGRRERLCWAGPRNRPHRHMERAPGRRGRWGHLQSSGLIWPMGLRIGVPDTTTEEARPW